MYFINLLILLFYLLNCLLNTIGQLEVRLLVTVQLGRLLSQFNLKQNKSLSGIVSFQNINLPSLLFGPTNIRGFSITSLNFKTTGKMLPVQFPKSSSKVCTPKVIRQGKLIAVEYSQRTY